MRPVSRALAIALGLGLAAGCSGSGPAADGGDVVVDVPPIDAADGGDALPDVPPADTADGRDGETDRRDTTDAAGDRADLRPDGDDRPGDRAPDGDAADRTPDVTIDRADRPIEDRRPDEGTPDLAPADRAERADVPGDRAEPDVALPDVPVEPAPDAARDAVDRPPDLPPLDFDPDAPPIPCDRLVLSSCPDRLACDILPGTCEFGCRPAGTGGVGAACARAAGSGCQPGLVCMNLGDGHFCYRWCTEDRDCGTGGLCLGGIAPEGESCADDVRICRRSGPPPDGGAPDVPAGPCNPLLLTGCPAGQTCYRADPSPVCAAPGSLPLGARCTAPTDCVPRAACISSTPGAPGVCIALCDAIRTCATGTGPCDPLAGATYGRCHSAPAPTYCNPAAQTGCPAGQACYHGDEHPYCAAWGTVPAGGRCDSGVTACEPGTVCMIPDVDGGGDRLCVELCDASTPCPTATAPCRMVFVGRTYGRCTGLPTPACDAMLQTGCATGQSCYPAAAGNLCATTGVIPIGEPCDDPAACVRGAACLGATGAPVPSGEEGSCRRLCDGLHECPSGPCRFEIPGSFYGFCGETVGVCDPVAQTGCGASQACYPTRGGPICDTPGTVPPGGACADDPTACAAGSTCVSPGTGLPGLCYKLCNATVRCPSELGGCETALVPAGAGYGLCGATGAACNPITRLGCPAAEACYPGLTGGDVCAAPGTVVTGGACTTFNSCVPGDGCSGEAGRRTCMRLCNETYADCPPLLGTCRRDAGRPHGMCVLSACSPILQTGCATGMACYPSAHTDVCATPGTLATGSPCARFSECRPGDTCAEVAGAITCMRLCDDTHACPPGRGTCWRDPPTSPYGKCIPTSCSPVAQTGCPSGQACYPNERVMTCAPPGTVPTGGACTTFAQCAPGNGCFPGRGACLRLCDGTHPCEGAGFRCRVGEGFPFGVCHNPSICDPIAATGCPSGQACYADRTGNLCAPAGTGARGSMCMNSTQCLPGHFCVPQAAGPPTCRPLCDGTAALACPAGSGTCRIGATGDAFGICQ